MILEKVGVREILAPEDEVGRTVAEMLLHPNMKSFLTLPDDYEIVEVEAPLRIVGRDLKDLGLREKYNLNLITIERNFDELLKNGEMKEVKHIIGVPKGDTKILNSDILIIMGKSKDVNKFIEVNK
jgi:trk system potassium uptake protein TrkA